MIVIHVQTEVKPDKHSDFIQQIQKDTEISRTFGGCVQLSWSQDVGRPNSFSLYEEWDSPEAFDTYKNSDHFKHMSDTLMPLMAEEPRSAYYTANSF